MKYLHRIYLEHQKVVSLIGKKFARGKLRQENFPGGHGPRDKFV
jgi:hypothetical protein